MKRRVQVTVCAWAVVTLAAGVAKAQQGNGSIVGWGSRVVGVDLSQGFMKIAAGAYHGLGLRADGSIAAWGNNECGQCNVPGPNSGFVAVAARGWHSLGLKGDGSIAAWGSGPGQPQAPNTGFVAIAAAGATAWG